MKKHFSKLLAALLALTLCLTACSQPANSNNSTGNDLSTKTEDPAGLFQITAHIGGKQTSLDPAKATVQGSETVLYHLFENLMRWEDDGNGYATLAPGQAESYEVETDYAGNATYTFQLRKDIQWSDGEAVTAQHFVAAWQRLADPANAMPHSDLLSVVAGYDQVQETGDVSHLAVSAPNDDTFVVTLEGSCAYFLSEVCAGAQTMPIRPEFMDDPTWGCTAESTICNGPYTAIEFRTGSIVLQRSETYYDAGAVGPDQITIHPADHSEADYEALQNGEIHLLQDLPLSALEKLAAHEHWRSEAVTTTYGVMLNTLAPPFDDPNIRLAFRLAIDTQAVADALADHTTHPAAGLVPYGVADYGQPTDPALEAEPTLPDPNAKNQEPEPVFYWDFRAHSEDLVTLSVESDYAASCLQAQALMAQAGYAKGGGFPVVEYIYVESETNRAIALALQSMWQEQLGVTVTVRGLSQNEYNTMLEAVEPEVTEEPTEGEPLAAAAPFQLAGQTFTACHNDAQVFLDPWHSSSEDNVTGYHSDAYDILLDSAKAAVSVEARDAYLHDAEAILLTDAPVIPVCYSGSSYQLAEGLSGLYRAPNGVFFLSAITDGKSAA